MINAGTTEWFEWLEWFDTKPISIYWIAPVFLSTMKYHPQKKDLNQPNASAQSA